ncbi:hypothetical protein NKR23_g817 [Pleurostoma richardsiae]|uniref:Uncharacterized protein n=1 Tax=Pleurostoma richardsiae TaxID=41990 RepID=A0AA38S538_9PEZI|nr:hypothetical protein NKR23_g817 [Pleurostoma richardsiae]
MAKNRNGAESWQCFRHADGRKLSSFSSPFRRKIAAASRFTYLMIVHRDDDPASGPFQPSLPPEWDIQDTRLARA